MQFSAYRLPPTVHSVLAHTPSRRIHQRDGQSAVSRTRAPVRFRLCSDRLDGGGSGALASPRGAFFLEFELDGLAFLKVVEADSCHRRMVEEYVPPFSRDESETSIRDHLLNNTLRHCCHPHITRWAKRPQKRIARYTRHKTAPDAEEATRHNEPRPVGPLLPPR